jgi:DNA-binding transcriptional LysR family regulator
MSRLPDLDVLELLVCVDDYGSLSEASRKVGMAQPNSSRAIKRLERRFGVPLLQRSTTGSTLTAEGTVVAHWAREIVRTAHRLLDVAEGLRVERSAELTVAASMTVAEHLMPRWLGQFRVEHPTVNIHLQVHNSTEVLARIAAGTCHVGFIESPHVPRGVHSLTVARDRLVLVVNADHPWARRRRPVTIAELAATPLLVREPGSGTRTTLEIALDGYELAPPLLELGSGAAIRTSVLNGVGPAVLSSLTVEDQVRAGDLRLVDVAGLDLTRALRAVWRPPRQLDGPAGQLVRLARRDGHDTRDEE